MDEKFLKDFYDMMIDVKTSMARLEEKFDSYEKTRKDNLEACSLEKSQILKALDDRISSLEKDRTWVVRIVLAAIMVAVLAGGYWVKH